MKKHQLRADNTLNNRHVPTRPIKKAIKSFQEKTNKAFVQHLNFRREFDVTQWMINKDISPELMWSIHQFSRFTRNRTFTADAVSAQLIPTIVLGETTHVMTSTVPQFMEQFRYNFNDTPNYPIYHGETMVKLSECSYYTGVRSKTLISLLHESILSFYYLDFKRVILKRDVLDYAKIRFRLPEIFFWIDKMQDSLVKEV